LLELENFVGDGVNERLVVLHEQDRNPSRPQAAEQGGQRSSGL
jgi:hypothetical protein